MVPVTPREKVFSPPDYLGVSVEKPMIPDFVRTAAKDNGLLEKPEFHISILVARNERMAWQAADARENADEMRSAIESLFLCLAWQYTPTNEYFLHERSYTKAELIDEGDVDTPPHTRRSVVQKVELPDLFSFYQKLNALLGTALPVPVPHITLFAWSDHLPYKTRGIGICSQEEFERFTKKTIPNT